MVFVRNIFLLITFTFAFGPMESSELLENEQKAEVVYQFNHKYEISEPSTKEALRTILAPVYNYSTADSAYSPQNKKVRLHLLYCCLLA